MKNLNNEMQYAKELTSKRIRGRKMFGRECKGIMKIIQNILLGLHLEEL